MGSQGRNYARAAGGAVLQGVLTTAWIAAEELPAGTRRLVRLGWTLAIVAAGALSIRNAPQVEIPEEVGVPEEVEVPEVEIPDRAELSGVEPGVDLTRVAAAAVLIPVLTVGPVILRRRLERRWLDRLIRAGHSHPHRAVALRIGLISLISALVSELAKQHRPSTPRPGRSG